MARGGIHAAAILAAGRDAGRGGGRRAWIAAVAATSVLFGLVHAYQGLAGMADTAIMGALLGTLHRVTRRNLWASIVAHGVMDTIGFVMIDLGIYPGL